MATTHREGSVIHHEGEKVTHIETGVGLRSDGEAEPKPEAPIEDVPAAAEPEAAPEPESAPVDEPEPAKKAEPVAKKAPRKVKAGKHRK